MIRVQWPLEIQVPRPTPSLNELKRKYRNFHALRREKNELRELWEREITIACGRRMRLLAIRDAVMKHPRMRLEIICRRKRLLDKDNLTGGLKSIIDAVTNCGLILDDSPRYVDLHVSQKRSGSGRPVTIFKLEPCE